MVVGVPPSQSTAMQTRPLQLSGSARNDPPSSGAPAPLLPVMSPPPFDEPPPDEPPPPPPPGVANVLFPFDPEQPAAMIQAATEAVVNSDIRSVVFIRMNCTFR